MELPQDGHVEVVMEVIVVELVAIFEHVCVYFIELGAVVRWVHGYWWQ